MNTSATEQRGHDGNKGDVFGYDEVRRLTNMKFNVPETEITNPGTTSFDKSWNTTYDKVDNIIKIAETENAQTTEITTSITGTHALLNQYTQFDQWGLGYDPNGNTTQKGTQGFTYDYRNQMVRAKEGGTTTAEYKYDALGRRIEKIAGSDTVKYYYDGNQVIEERNASDQVLKQYVYGNGIDELLIIVDFDGAAQNSYYVHTNAVGSITAITDQNGDVVERVSYDVFGMPTFTDYKTDPANPTVVSDSVIGNEYLFQRRRYDKETNLYYYRARHYDPIMGRFLQTDPMGYHDSMNMYQAFNNNPTNFVDPSGTTIYPSDYKAIRKMIKGPGGAEYAKKWVSGCPRFTSGEKVSLTLGIMFGLKDPDEFSVAKYTFDKTTYQLYGWFWTKVQRGVLDEKYMGGCNDAAAGGTNSLIKIFYSLMRLINYEYAFEEDFNRYEKETVSTVNKTFNANPETAMYAIGEFYTPVVVGAVIGGELSAGMQTQFTDDILPLNQISPEGNEFFIGPQKTHANSLTCSKTNYGYAIRDIDTGKVLKYGETINPKYRYTKEFYKRNNAYMDIMTDGSKAEIHNWQHQQILKYKALNNNQRPPLNLSDW